MNARDDVPHDWGDGNNMPRPSANRDMARARASGILDIQAFIVSGTAAFLTAGAFQLLSIYAGICTVFGFWPFPQSQPLGAALISISATTFVPVLVFSVTFFVVYLVAQAWFCIIEKKIQ